MTAARRNNPDCAGQKLGSALSETPKKGRRPTSSRGRRCSDPRYDPRVRAGAALAGVLGGACSGWADWPEKQGETVCGPKGKLPGHTLR